MGTEWGSSITKGSVKKFMFICNFLRGFFTMKVVKNSPQNARNCTIFKIFLGGHAPKPPSQRLAASLLATRRFAACISKIPELLKLGPPP